MKILVTGANGQLGKALLAVAPPEVEVVAAGRNELDITDGTACHRFMETHKPEVVIHAAAYTAVDRAEEAEAEAYRVNAAGTRNVAVATEAIGAKICYVSTDYVFDGTSGRPYREYDRTNPLSVYGKSKLAGEVLVQTLSSKYWIVRTSWLFGREGNNFVNTILRMSSLKSDIQVVHDQVGSPTYTKDLADFLLSLTATEAYGIYHATNTGSCSWYELAFAIVEERGLSLRIHPCSTAEFPRPARRPSYSVMEPLAIAANGFAPLRPWREALADCLRQAHEEPISYAIEDEPNKE